MNHVASRIRAAEPDGTGTGTTRSPASGRFRSHVLPLVWLSRSAMDAISGGQRHCGSNAAWAVYGGIGRSAPETSGGGGSAKMRAEAGSERRAGKGKPGFPGLCSRSSKVCSIAAREVGSSGLRQELTDGHVSKRRPGFSTARTRYLVGGAVARSSRAAYAT